MKTDMFKITRIEIRNFKNVRKGCIDIPLYGAGKSTSVVGLYGQNGSGKTSVIEALNLLKTILSGDKVDDSYIELINNESDTADFSYEFAYTSDDNRYKVGYDFSLRAAVSTESREGQKKVIPMICDEVITYSVFDKSDNVIVRKNVLIDTTDSDTFRPNPKYKVLTGGADRYKVVVAKKLAQADSRSFIFSRSFIQIISDGCEDKEYLGIFYRMMKFGEMELFVIPTENSGMISLYSLPINFKIEIADGDNYGTIAIPIHHPTVVRQDVYNVSNEVIENMNTVLTKIIPDLTVELKKLGPSLLDDGTSGIAIQVVAHRKDRTILLKNESEGIRKIISVLQLLISVYNNPSVCVAIDELDSGVFEYLLGELVSIINEKGKGQLIFTSHNLRPLEKINKNSIVFTTVDEDDRYTRIKYVKNNNNLRDVYYREILLGSKDVDLYESTDDYEIDLAFRKAGEHLVT